MEYVLRWVAHVVEHAENYLLNSEDHRALDDDPDNCEQTDARPASTQSGSTREEVLAGYL